jgi:hypothetical protein
LAWVEHAGYQNLEDIEPITVAAYIETFQRQAAPPTVKQHMAAIRMLFSWLTEKGVLAIESGPGSQDRKIFTDRREKAGICRRRGSEDAGDPRELRSTFHEPACAPTRGRPNSRVTSRHFDHSSDSRAFMKTVTLPLPSWYPSLR